MKIYITSGLKKTIKFGFLFSLYCLLVFSTNAQDTQSDYLKSKTYFNNKEYNFSMEGFRKLSLQKENNPYQSYAYFYYALSAYLADQKGLARSVWLQMLDANLKWTGIDEVYFWLSKVYFEEENIPLAMQYAAKCKLPEIAALKSQGLHQYIDSKVLVELYALYPDDKELGLRIIELISQDNLGSKNFELLNDIIDKYHLDKTKYGFPDIGKSELKKNYKIAVLLPFLFDGLNNTSRITRNKFIMDLYNGIEMAVAELNGNAPFITLYPYDTKKNKEETAKILSFEEMKSMDLIIGPLFPEPINLVKEFSFKHKINMINPLSTSAQVIENNPYAFLFKPMLETQSLVAARFAIDSLGVSRKKNAMIFYEDNSKDSLSAHIYANELKKNGFDILMNKALLDSTVRVAFELLTEKYEKEYSKEWADTLLARNKNHPVKVKKSKKEKDVLIYYEEFLRIPPDHIGHIFVASSKVAFASSFISAIEVRNDSTVLIGRGEWKDYSSLTFDEMEKLNVYFIDPEFVDKTTETYSKFRNDYISSYHQALTFNTELGYEMMMHLGYMLKNYGTYYQMGYISEGQIKGQLMQSNNFMWSNSNQYVPITKFVNSAVLTVYPINK